MQTDKWNLGGTTGPRLAGERLHAAVKISRVVSTVVGERMLCWRFATTDCLVQSVSKRSKVEVVMISWRRLMGREDGCIARL